MKNLYKTILILFLIVLTSINASERKVLVEILTNSHCPVCPPSHTSLNSYLKTANGSKIEFIYYHMAFPYSSDQLYQHNTSDASAKNILYGPASSTPQAYFNGTHVSNSYNNWASNLDNLVAESSPLEISLSGSYTTNDFTINAAIVRTGDITESDLKVNFVVVENIDYLGQNNIRYHKNVMRKIAKVNGDAISIALNETKNMSTSFAMNNSWNTDSIKVIAYVQSTSSKKVLQSKSISYSELTLTDVEEERSLTNEFQLSQNYPNPFNPTTTIEYTIPLNTNVASSFSSSVVLKIYDVLGRDVATLVNEVKNSGTHKAVLNAESLSNGIYYYRLTVGNFVETRKMILLK